MTHHFGGRGEEVTTALPPRVGLTQLEVRLVDQGRGVERVPRSQASQLAARQDPEFVVHHRHQIVERTTILGEFVQDGGDGTIPVHPDILR
jgi:hypothetical protein